MAVEINGKVYRNLPEQVKKNQEDIEDLQEAVTEAQGDIEDLQAEIVTKQDKIPATAEDAGKLVGVNSSGNLALVRAPETGTTLYLHKITILGKGYLEIISTYSHSYSSQGQLQLLDDLKAGKVISGRFNYESQPTNNMVHLYTFDEVDMNGYVLYGLYHDTNAPYTDLIGVSIYINQTTTFVDNYAPLA